MEEATVFYSWQSDLPGKTNRSLIQDALEGAVGALAAQGTLSIVPVLDRDTQGIPGSPDIGQAIFSKIATAAALVCDVSLINGTDGATRPTPNPNVLIELGYALKALGWERVVLVFNTAFGRIEDLPFDLRQKRALTYNSAEADSERAPPRGELRNKLTAALSLILAHHVQANAAPSRALAATQALATKDAGAAAAVADFMEEVAARISAAAPAPPQDRPLEDLVFDAISNSVGLAEEFAQVASDIARHNNSEAALKMFHGFGPILQLYDRPPRTGGSFFTAIFDPAKFLGYEFFTTLVGMLLKHDRMEVLGAMLSERLTMDTDEGYATAVFPVLSAGVPSLRRYFQVRGTNFTSPQAELLKERHGVNGRLGEVCPWRLFIEADFLLYLKSSFEFEGWPGVWTPWCYPYLVRAGTPRWLARAESRRRLTELCSVFGGVSQDEFRKLYTKHAGKAGMLLPDYAGFPPSLPPADRLGSTT